MAGRPPTFETVEDLDKSIQDYFDKGVKVRKVLVNKGPKRHIEELPVPTITGLCYYLGFESRQSFYDYEQRPEFSYTVKRARLFIEKEYEEQLSVGNTVGAIFALKNMGWKDKVETGFTDGQGNDVNPVSIIQLPDNNRSRNDSSDTAKEAE